jgi:hypothetical protein
MKEMRIFLIIVPILLVFSFGTVACSSIEIKPEENKKLVEEENKKLVEEEKKKLVEEEKKKLVDKAINLKNINMQESTIIDHLAYVDRKYDSRVYFGKCPLSADQIDSLRKAGFQNDFIAKFEGQPQYVTLGVAGVWLQKTADLVYAPIIRIFLKPRSYFHAYRPYFFGRWGLSQCGLLQLDRWDINVGLTNKTQTAKSSETEEKERYILIGLSNQLNQSAFLNIGCALLPGDTKYVDSQFYVGFTLDSNFLKEIGIIGK